MKKQVQTKVEKLLRSKNAAIKELYKENQELRQYCEVVMDAIRDSMERNEISVMFELQNTLNDVVRDYRESHDALTDLLKNSKNFDGKYTMLPLQFVKECSRYEIM